MPCCVTGMRKSSAVGARIDVAAEFIAAAEETDLIIAMGERVLTGACHQAQQWQREFPRDEQLFIAVNLSAKQFTQRDLVEVVERVLQESGSMSQARDH